MSQNPGMDERLERDDDRDDDKDTDTQVDERNKEETPNKGHGPLKGTDTAATTFAEDLDKARRTTM